MKFKKRFMYALMNFVPEIKCSTALVLLKILYPSSEFRIAYTINLLLFP